MLTKTTNVLVTGVTGLIGGELVRSLARSEVGRVLCLIRPTFPVRDRLAQRLTQSGEAVDHAYLEPVAGDVALPRFGLSDRDYDDIASCVDIVIHCASELSFIRDAHCRRTNVLGMHNLVELVRSCKREPTVVHIGTAASCGAVSHRCMSEGDGSNPGNQHHNEYTRTKAVAEQVLRD
jgi:thioester reductase-like protein